MVDHDELLPAEQANPDLLQELRAIYQMKPAEKRVLDRVQTRLAENTQSLPLRETVPAKAHDRHLWLISMPPASARSQNTSKKWLRPLNGLVAILLVGLLIGAFALTLSLTGSTSANNGIHLFLAATENGSTPTQTMLDRTRALLEQRFNDFNLQNVSVQQATRNGQVGFQLELARFGGNEQQTLDTLVAPGTLGFWGTGNALVNAGTTFDARQYVQYNPGGKPRFTGQDLNPNSLMISHDESGQWLINCEMQGSAIQRFYTYTTANLGRYLTTTFDGKVIMSAVIQSAINGPFVIANNFTQQQAKAILADLRSGALPLVLAPVS